MKFKATFGSPIQLSKLIQTLDKLAETCVVHLTPEMLRFSVVSEGKDNLNLHVCADVSQDTIFLDYAIQSKAENNRISFFVKTENLSRALRSCCSAGTEHIQLKLTKKQGVPALTFEINESSVQVLHEVPIRIVADPRETQAYAEPAVGDDSDAAIAVIFPSSEFKSLKNVVERMRTVNEWMRLSTSRGVSRPELSGGGGDVDGGGTAELQLLVERAELVKIQTTYPRLGMPTSVAEADDVSTGVDPSHLTSSVPPNVPATAAASVEVKKLLRVLQSLCSSDLKIQNAIVCIVPGSMVILKIYLPDNNNHQSFMIYYLPVMAEPDD